MVEVFDPASTQVLSSWSSIFIASARNTEKTSLPDYYIVACVPVAMIT
jgi:hypothetical protein